MKEGQFAVTKRKRVLFIPRQRSFMVKYFDMGVKNKKNRQRPAVVAKKMTQPDSTGRIS